MVGVSSSLADRLDQPLHQRQRRMAAAEYRPGL
jgi:hypothetical protein